MYYSVILELDKGEAGMLGDGWRFFLAREGLKRVRGKEDSMPPSDHYRDLNGAGYVTFASSQSFNLFVVNVNNPMFNQQQYNVKAASSSHRAGSSYRILHKLKHLYVKCDQKQEANCAFCCLAS